MGRARDLHRAGTTRKRGSASGAGSRCIADRTVPKTDFTGSDSDWTPELVKEIADNLHVPWELSDCLIRYWFHPQTMITAGLPSVRNRDQAAIAIHRAITNLYG